MADSISANVSGKATLHSVLHRRKSYHYTSQLGSCKLRDFALNDGSKNFNVSSIFNYQWQPVYSTNVAITCSSYLTSLISREI